MLSRRPTPGTVKDDQSKGEVELEGSAKNTPILLPRLTFRRYSREGCSNLQNGIFRLDNLIVFQKETASNKLIEFSLKRNEMMM